MTGMMFIHYQVENKLIVLLKNNKMKKIIMMVCGVTLFGITTLVQAQDQDSASTNFNNQNPVEQQEQPTQESPALDQPTQDQSTQPTQDPAPVQDPAVTPPTQDQPTQDQPVQDGTNAIPQGQSRESAEPTEDQTDQSMDKPSPAPAVTPIENKVGPNGEAIFIEGGKFHYMNEAGEKKEIKESELKDKTK